MKPITPIKEMAGQRFGRLLVLCQNGRTKGSQVLWLCRCDCGKEHTTAGENLRSGRTMSCGCLREEMRVTLRQKNHVGTGLSYGRLTTVLMKQGGKSHERTWMCRCLCGNITEANEHSLIYGGKKSCGCLFLETRDAGAEANTIHGQGNTRTGLSWYMLMKRCTNPKNNAFKNYGARGIKPCAFIRESPTHLFSLLGERPEGLTLDRIDNDGGYTCGSCEECKANNWPHNLRWATRKTQANNRRPSDRWTK